MMNDFALARRKLVYIEDGVAFFTPCIELVVLFTTPLADACEGLAEFYSTIRGFLDRRIQFWSTNAMKHMRPASPGTLEMFPFWMTDRRALVEPLIGLQIHSGEFERSMVAPAFEFFYDQTIPENSRGFVRLCLPVDEQSQTGKHLTELAIAAVAPLTFDHGSMGFSLCWNTSASDPISRAPEWAVPLLKRYPGLGMGFTLPFMFHADKGILMINWITLLGGKRTSALGDIDLLRERAGPLVQVMSVGDEASLLRAGEAPRLGDRNRGESLPGYKRIGDLLNEFRAPASLVADINMLVFRGDDKIAWLDRFFPGR